MFKTTHSCAFKKTDEETESQQSYIQKLKRKLQQCTLISPNHPYSYHYFRSELLMKRERKKQLALGRFAIHPFSSFRKWYEVYLVFLYMSVLFTKPFEASFMSSAHGYQEIPFLNGYIVLTDVLCWVDIAVNFVTGYFTKNMKTVELKRSAIAKMYIFGPYFICDVLSSVSKPLVVYYFQNKSIFNGFVNIVCFLKAVRVISLIIYADRMVQSLKDTLRGTFFLIGNIILSFIVIHWMACLQFGMSMLIRFHFWPKLQNLTWISQSSLLEKSVFHQYIHSYLKSSAYILGVRITFYHEQLPEEYLMAAFTYIIGKILVVLTWISLAVAILNSRSVNIKFAEIINQLDEYMKQKQLPLNLQERISNYYIFKFQRKYFKEGIATGLVPESIKREMKVRECRNLISNAYLFENLSSDEIASLVDVLEPEIYLPNDRIITSGSRGDSMYFLSSGTVAVYTRSGKELCHLHDGMYFGEISLILKGKTVMATVVAIEPCHVYKLTRKNFERCLLNNPKVLEKLTKNAEEKMSKIMTAEEEYWKSLFEETFLQSGQTR